MKAPIDKYYATILLGAAELVGAFSCVILVHITGKRPLVFTSLIGTGVCFFAAATYARYLNIVPGVSVENVVANYSIPLSEREHFINEKNLTELFESNSTWPMDETTTENLFSTTTEFIEYGSTSTIDYNDNDTTTGMSTESSESTTHRFKRMNAPQSHINKSELIVDDSPEIILPIPNVKENKFLWLPLTLLLTGALFAHLGIRIIPWMLIGEVFPVNVRRYNNFFFFILKLNSNQLIRKFFSIINIFKVLHRGCQVVLDTFSPFLLTVRFLLIVVVFLLI